MIALLVRSGADLARCQERGEKAITLLLRGRPLEEIQKAVAESGKSVDGIPWLDGSLLYWAALDTRMDVAEWLLAKGVNPTGTNPSMQPLAAAIAEQDLPMVKFLVKSAADPDLWPKGGISPRELAYEIRNREILAALPPSKEEIDTGKKQPLPESIKRKTP